jgi:hypothetical protein
MLARHPDVRTLPALGFHQEGYVCGGEPAWRRTLTGAIGFSIGSDIFGVRSGPRGPLGAMPFTVCGVPRCTQRALLFAVLVCCAILRLLGEDRFAIGRAIRCIVGAFLIWICGTPLCIRDAVDLLAPFRVYRAPLCYRRPLAHDALTMPGALSNVSTLARLVGWGYDRLSHDEVPSLGVRDVVSPCKGGVSLYTQIIPFDQG